MLKRQKVKENIAKDRAASKLAREAEAAARSGVPVAAASAPVQAQPPQQLNEKKEYDECRIQVRLTNGQSIVEKFRATESFAAV